MSASKLYFKSQFADNEQIRQLGLFISSMTNKMSKGMSASKLYFKSQFADNEQIRQLGLLISSMTNKIIPALLTKWSCQADSSSWEREVISTEVIAGCFNRVKVPCG